MADYLRKQLDIDGLAIFPYTHADSVVYTPKVNFGNSVPANTLTNVMAVLDALDNTYRRQDSNITSLYRVGGKSGFLYQNGASTTAFMDLPTLGANYYIPTLNYTASGDISTNWLSYTTSVTNGSTALVTSGAVYNAITSGIKANDAMLFKGVINANSGLPADHTQGWTYKVGTAGTYAGLTCEVGDMIICITSRTTANNADWLVIQNNIDGAVITSNNSSSKHLAIFDGTKTIKPLTDTFPAVTKSGLLKLAVGGTDAAPTYTYSWDTTSYLSSVPEATATTHGGFKLVADGKDSTQQQMNASTTGAGKYAVRMNADGTLYVAITQANTNTWRSIQCDENTATETTTSSGVLKFVSGTNISLGWTNTNNAPTITVNHGSVTCNTTDAADANSGTALSHSGEFVVPTAMTVSGLGHVTALTWTRYKLPASGNTDNTAVFLGTEASYVTNKTKKTDTTKITKASSTGLAFVGGTNKFYIGDGTNYIEVAVTPSINNNITGSGASGNLAKFDGNNTITSGPTLAAEITSLSLSTKFLREDGTWAAPSYTANTDTKVTTALTTAKMYIIGKSDGNKATASTALYDANLYVTNGALNASSLATSGNVAAGGIVTGNNLWDISSVESSKSITFAKETWVAAHTYTTLPTSGTYVILISGGNIYASGVFSIAANDAHKEEIPLHVCGKTDTWRPWAKWDGSSIYLASSTAVTISVTIKIKRLI